MTRTKVSAYSVSKIDVPTKKYGIYHALLPASEFCRIPSECAVGKRGNVRLGLKSSVAHDGQVRSAVQHSEYFPVLHDGTNTICTGVHIGKRANGRTPVTLTNAVITNGHQTKATFESENGLAEDTLIDCRIVVAPDEDDDVFVSVGGTQNAMNPVQGISIHGHAGHLEALEDALGFDIPKFESDADWKTTLHWIQKGLAYYGKASGPISGAGGLETYQSQVAQDRARHKEFLAGIRRIPALERHILGLRASKDMQKGAPTRCLTARALVIPFLYGYGGCGGAFHEMKGSNSAVDKAVSRVLKRNLRSMDNFSRKCTVLSNALREQVRDAIAAGIVL